MPDPLQPYQAPFTPQPPAGFTPPPAANVPTAQSVNPAADVIRLKLNQIFAAEPDAATELAEAEATPRRSRHQQYMHELSTSGKDLAAIQTDWHNYYVQLNDTDKHQVWQEFYSTSAVPNMAETLPKAEQPHAVAAHKSAARSVPQYKKSRARRPKRDLRTPQAIRATIRDQVTANGKLTAKHHLQSLLFGLSAGALVIFVFLFGLFNQAVLAPFIQPSRAAAATPIIVDSSSVAPTTTPQVIIPKINVQIPVDYTQTASDEETIQTALESGVVRYPTTSLPGTQGNTAIFGHSSNNIFNKGKYKFAFVLLNKLVIGDTFYLTYNNKVYVYKVITRTIVDPSEVGVLGPVDGKLSTATLITCDPPGTSLKRLVVVGEQISPDPSGNSAAPTAAPSLGANSPALPGNGPILAARIISNSAAQTLGAIVIVVGIGLVLRRAHRSRQ